MTCTLDIFQSETSSRPRLSPPHLPPVSLSLWMWEENPHVCSSSTSILCCATFYAVKLPCVKLVNSHVRVERESLSKVNITKWMEWVGEVKRLNPRLNEHFYHKYTLENLQKHHNIEKRSWGVREGRKSGRSQNKRKRDKLLRVKLAFMQLTHFTLYYDLLCDG